MKLKIATQMDESIIGEWLKNEEDCLLVTNKIHYQAVDYFNWLAAKDQHGYFLINENQEVVGYGEIWVDEEQKDLELAHLIINPSMRNKGYGKTLISLLEEKAKQFQFPVIYMRVNPDNTKAIHCYLKSHYEVDPHLNEVFHNKWTWLKKNI